ncbi:MAG: hypothetical protein AAF914_09250 [Pseudomonadota bacterium]
MGRRRPILVFGILAAAGGLFATKPSESDVNDLIGDRIRAELALGAQTGDSAVAALSTLCTILSDDCVALVQQTVPISYGDLIFAADVRLFPGSPDEVRCVGMLTQLYCPGIINRG